MRNTQKRLTMLGAGVMTAVLVVMGCNAFNQSATAQMDGGDGVDMAVAVLHPTEGNDAHGTIRFRAEGGQVIVRADIRGLEPNSVHGFHIHEYGDCTAADGTSAGGHYNPEGVKHGLPPDTPRHAGDLGNLEADASGRATQVLTVDNITIDGERNPILGHGMILHGQRDDGGQPTGNAGARLACGVIGIANPNAK